MSYSNKEKLYEHQRKYRAENKRKALDYLRSHPCIDCGETDPIVLVFDHIDPKTKKFTIANAISGSTRSWNLIYKEIQKCEIRCQNCHVKKHANGRLTFRTL